MKTTLLLLLSGLLFCGCAHQQATSPHRAIDSIVAGKEVSWGDGIVLRVAEREGDSVAGIRILSKAADGQVTTTTAETGTLEIGSVEMPTDASVVRITLHNAQMESATERATAQKMMLVLRR